MRGFICYRTPLEALDHNMDCDTFLEVEIGESYMNNTIVTNYVRIIKEIVLHHNKNLFTGIVISNGKRKYYHEGLVHRLNKPAVECLRTGSFVYYENGMKHRHGDKPACINGDHIEYWVNGKLDRENGPAIENSLTKIWYVKGKRHRTDGPAYIHKHGLEQWFEDDLFIKEKRQSNYDSDSDLRVLL